MSDDTSMPARKLDIIEMLVREEQPIPYRVEKLAADGFVTGITGHGGEGKSLVAMALGVGVAAGTAPGGLQCRKGKALVIDGENGEHLIARRLKRTGCPLTGVALYEAAGLDLARDCGWLIETISAERANFVVIDSLRTLAPNMAENDGDTVLPVMASLREAARETQAAILFLHHRPKHGAGYRGSSVLRDQVDALFVLGRDASDPRRKTRRYLHCDPARDGKMRFDAEPETRWIEIVIEPSRLTIVAAEPYGGESKDPTVEDIRCDEIVTINPDHLSGSAICRKLGEKTTDPTTWRALKRLVETAVLTRHEDKTYTLFARRQTP
jgi:AAA domain